MNSFHQTDPSSALLDKSFAEKILVGRNWETTGMRESRRKEAQTFMVQCPLIVFAHHYDEEGLSISIMLQTSLVP